MNSAELPARRIYDQIYFKQGASLITEKVVAFRRSKPDCSTSRKDRGEHRKHRELRLKLWMSKKQEFFYYSLLVSTPDFSNHTDNAFYFLGMQDRCCDPLYCTAPPTNSYVRPSRCSNLSISIFGIVQSSSTQVSLLTSGQFCDNTPYSGGH